ncbi:MAG TPA: sialidase family protein [Planctomycetota bacterium]|nr:sialidase family protein [Planctomycetota bacterium]
MILTAWALAGLLDGGTQVAPDAIQPHLAIDRDGRIYVAFIRGGQIELSVSDDRGKTFGAAVVAIDAKGRARGGMQRGPRVAVDGKNTVYVTAPLTFDDAEFQKRYPTQDLWLAVSTDGGKTFGRPVQVNDAPKKAPESLHWLAASPVEGAFVAWLDLRQREKGQDLFVAKITDQGRKVSRNVPVAMNLCECCAPGLAVDGKGNPTLIYREGGKSSRQIFLALSSNGGASFSKVSRINQGESKVDT